MNSPNKPARKRRFVLILVILAIGIVVLTVALCNRQTNLPDQLSWLTPAEFAEIKRTGPLIRLKFQLMRWTAPLWKSYWRNQPQFTIGAKVITVPAEPSWPTNSFSPFVTATNGTRAWILSDAQLKDLQAEITALPEAAIAARSQVMVGGGISAAVSSGNSFGSGSNSIFVGSAVFFIPTSANDRILLTFELKHSQLETNLTSQLITVRTNQAYACRAVFPNDGGLLLENPKPEPGASNRHWLFLSARAVDANGRLIGR
jgi:hypothetical protein